MPRNNNRKQDARAGRGWGSGKPATDFTPNIPRTRVEPADDLKREREKLEATLADLKASIQEAHGLLSDLRIETRQARRLVPMQVTNRITKELDKQLPHYFEALGKQVDKAEAAIIAKFEDMYATLVGRDTRSRKEGLKPIDELIGNLREVEVQSREHARLLDMQNVISQDRDKDAKSNTGVGTIPGFEDL